MNWLPFDKVITDNTSNYHKIKKEDYLNEGLYKIIDQGQTFVGGYTNNGNLITDDDLPVIVFGDHTRILKYIDFPFTIGADGVKVLLINKEIAYPKFVYYFLKSIKLTEAGYSRHFKFLKEIKIPIQNLEDQIRIANILSKAEALITQRKESLRLLDELLKSTFLEMFGDPVRNEKGWTKSKIIDFADCIVPGRDKPKSFTGETPWITTDDLIHLGFTTLSKKSLGLSFEEINEVRARVIPANSIIITCVGDLGVVSINSNTSVVNQQLHSFQCKTELNNIFAMYSLSFEKKFMYKSASTTTVPYMNKTICNSIPVIVPPLKLQTQFAHIVEKTEALKTHYQTSLQELENLYGSLSQRAFSSSGASAKADKGELNLKGEGASYAEASEDTLAMAAEPKGEAIRPKSKN